MVYSFVQVASCTNQMGQIAIVAMQNSSPKVTECFNVESRILCMTFVPTEQLQENGENIPENNHVPLAKASETPSVCLGMEEGRYRFTFANGNLPVVIGKNISQLLQSSNSETVCRNVFF